jgi:hypothetical protein
LEDEETLSHGDIDKDMAYAVRINFNAPLGDEAAVAALFGDDIGDEGILDKPAEMEKRNSTQLGGPIPPKPADIREGKIAIGASTLNAPQERVTKDFRETEEGGNKVPLPSALQKNTKSDQTEGGIETKGSSRKKQAGGERSARTQQNRSGP